MQVECVTIDFITGKSEAIVKLGDNLLRLDISTAFEVLSSLYAVVEQNAVQSILSQLATVTNNGGEVANDV